MFLNLNGRLVDVSSPVVMGIVNVTPDSFYTGSRFLSEKSILTSVDNILSNGGTIVDVGAYSTRPSAESVSVEEELKRLSRALEIILKQFPNVILSVDTFRSKVARYVIENFHVAMINDIGGGTLDELMFETVADLRVAYVLMHMRGTPQTMQTLTHYENNVVSEVYEKVLKTQYI